MSWSASRRRLGRRPHQDGLGALRGGEQGVHDGFLAPVGATLLDMARHTESDDRRSESGRRGESSTWAVSGATPSGRLGLSGGRDSGVQPLQLLLTEVPLLGGDQRRMRRPRRPIVNLHPILRTSRRPAPGRNGGRWRLEGNSTSPRPCPSPARRFAATHYRASVPKFSCKATNGNTCDVALTSSLSPSSTRAKVHR